MEKKGNAEEKAANAEKAKDTMVVFHSPDSRHPGGSLFHHLSTPTGARQLQDDSRAAVY